MTGVPSCIKCMVTPTDADTTQAEVGNHLLTAEPGRINHEQIWQCELCDVERVNLTEFTDIECEAYDERL